MTEWISVQKALPKQFTVVKIKFNNNEVNNGMLNPYGTGWISFAEGTGTEVTHWHEMPK